MADDPGAAVSPRAKDLDLLSSGNFADVEVVCGNRTWKCHRAILVPRSVWFEKALAGPFEEASTKKINLNEENPAFVDLAIKYIYGEGLDVESSVSPEHFIEHCVSLWHIADFLLLDPLKDLVQRAVHSYCDKQMKTLCTLGNHPKWHDEGQERKLSPWARDLLSGVRESYKWNCVHLKAVLLEFLWVGRFWTLFTAISPTLVDHTKDIPRFMDDLLGEYASRSWIDKAVWAPASQAKKAYDKCRGCKKKISWAGQEREGQIMDPFEVDRHSRITSGWCRDCSKLDTIPWRT